MGNSLNLAGDGDDLDVIADVERTFGIVITDAEAETPRTVGQLHDLIQAKCDAGGTEACFTQVAFYALRRAFASFGRMGITPDTPVSVVRELCDGSIVQAWKELGRRSSLQLPPMETPFRVPKPPLWSARIFWTLAAIAFAAGMYVADRHFGVPPVHLVWIVPIGLFLLGSIAQYGSYLVFRDIPLRITTVGELAREAAGYSFSTLSQTRPRPSSADRWYALTAILRQISGHKLPISRDTTFFSRP